MRNKLMVAVCVALPLASAGCAHNTEGEAIVGLLPTPAGVALRVENASDATIVIETFAVAVCESSGERIVKMASDYPQWFPLRLSANTAVEFTIESDVTRPHSATVVIVEGNNSKRYIVRCAP